LLKDPLALFAHDDGRVDRPVSATEWWVSPAYVEGDDVVVDLSGDESSVKAVHPSSKLLDNFLKLSDAPASRILRFVNTWGLIGFGRVFQDFAMHGIGGETARQTIIQTAKAFLGIVIENRHIEKQRDPIEAYRTLAKYVHALLGLAIEVENNAADAQIWQAKYPVTFPNVSYGRDAACDEIQMKVNRLLQFGGVALTLDRAYEENRWRTVVGFNHGTLGAIAIQVVLMVARTDSLYSCSGCGSPYIRTHTHQRRPKAFEGNYCSECNRSGRPVIDAKRRYRDKMREARRLSAAGFSISLIAEQLDTESENVKRWIKEKASGKKKTR